jgi:hypothetical protein
MMAVLVRAAVRAIRTKEKRLLMRALVASTVPIIDAARNSDIGARGWGSPITHPLSSAPALL